MPGAEPSFGARFLAEADGCTPGDEASYISRKARELRPGRTDFFPLLAGSLQMGHCRRRRHLRSFQIFA
jgi:hypothetical protein